MNRYEFEKAVYESGLNRTCKQILVYFAFRKNWTADSKVWGTPDNIGKALDMSSRTVETWLPKIREAGWLIDTGERRQGNGRPVIVYDLAVGTLTEMVSVKPPRVKARKTASNQDLTEMVSGKYQSDGTDLNRNGCTKSMDLTEMVADLTEMVSVEQDINKIKEEQVSAPAAPVDLEDEFSIRKDEEVTTSPSTLPNEESEAKPSMAPEEPVLPKKRIENYFDLRNEFIKVSALTKLPKEVHKEAEALVLDPDFKPEVSRPSIRVNDAIARAWQDFEARGGN